MFLPIETVFFYGASRSCKTNWRWSKPPNKILPIASLRVILTHIHLVTHILTITITLILMDVVDVVAVEEADVENARMHPMPLREVKFGNANRT
jgi:hypothetical protein